MTSHNYDVLCVAQWFIDRARENRDYGDVITLPKLQKLVYYAEAWSMVLNDAQLFDDDIQAWAQGPTVKALWDAVEGNIWSDLDQADLCRRDPHDGVFDAASLDVFEQVWQGYGDETSKFLADLTRGEAPWKAARGSLRPEAACNAPISRAIMLDFYAKAQHDSEANQALAPAAA